MNKAALTKFIIPGFMICLLGCATVPKEVVNLSYAIGDDLTAVHASYRTLVTSYFNGLKERVNNFIDNEWKPDYLKSFIKKGNLVKLATDPDPDKVLTGIGIWTEIAIKTIEDKRKSLTEPIDTNKQALLESVDKAFNQLYKANATVTAHLNSIRKVKDQEAQLLSSLHLQNLRTQIEQDLSGASEQVNTAIKAVSKAEKKIRSLTNSPHGGGNE
ncbi:hypothetical protein KAR48_05345 [bacterium]|nr:hypothetical protein [bacterium]